MQTLSALKLSLATRFLNQGINKEDELRDIAELAAALFAVPFAVITIAGDDKPYVNNKFTGKAVDGMVTEPLYQHLATKPKSIIIDNAGAKSDLKHRPLFIHQQKIKFYASTPLITHDGHLAGNLLLMHHKPGKFKKAQRQLFKIIIKHILHLVEFEQSLQVIKEQHTFAGEADLKLRSFFESSAACHLLIGKEMEVIAFNRNMAELIATYHHVTLYPGINVAKILREKYLQDFIADYKKALSGIPVMYEREVEYDGVTIWWYVTFEPSYNMAGEIAGISYNAADITVRKQNESKISAQNSSLSTIANFQSHELRRPVASILGFMYLFKGEGYQASVDELMMMERAVEELDNKIKEIVQMSTPY